MNIGYAVSGPSSSGVGGLNGRDLLNIAINNSSNSGSVNREYNVGGLIELVQSLNTISKSYNSGFVSGYSQINCLIGDGNSILISDSFNKALVRAVNTNLGGLVGRSQTITITNSLNLGSVSGSNDAGELIT